MKRTIYLFLTIFASGCSGTLHDDDDGAAKLTDEIRGGHVAQPGEAPWQVEIRVQGLFQCGGALVAPDWVLTAAHCTFPLPSAYVVILGDRNQTTNEGTEQNRLVDQRIMHPDFYTDQFRTLVNDVALLHVTSPFKIKPGVVELIPLSAQRAEDLSETLVTGWGDGEVLSGAALPILDASACAAAPLSRPQLLPSELCVGYLDGFFHDGTCHGDSGGSLVARNDSTGAWQQVGIVSWGHPDCTTYSVFERVQSYLPFIRKYVVDVASLTAVDVALQ